MAQSETTFEISRDIIEFGDRVVAVRQVVFAGCRHSHPWRPVGVGLLMLSIAGFAYETAMVDGLTTLKAGGSTKLWLAFVLAGISVFAIVYQRRALVLALADGSKIRLQGGSNEFQERVVACIGDAIKAAPGAAFHVSVDLRAQTIDGLGYSDQDAGAQATAVTRQPHTQATAQARTIDRTDVTANTRMRLQQTASAGPANGRSLEPMGVTRNEPERHAPAGHAPGTNGYPHVVGGIDGRNDTSGPGMAPAWLPQVATTSIDTFPGGQHPPLAGHSGTHSAAQQAGVRPLRDASNPLRDMETLIDFVRRSDIQHKAALLDLLGVAQDYLQGGATVRDDAIAHWHSFSAYVHQYLAAVDGLVPLTERASRPFAAH